MAARLNSLDGSSFGAAGDVDAVGGKLGGHSIGVVGGDRRPDAAVQINHQARVLAGPLDVKVEPMDEIAAALDTRLPHEPHRHYAGLADGGGRYPLRADRE